MDDLEFRIAMHKEFKDVFIHIPYCTNSMGNALLVSKIIELKMTHPFIWKIFIKVLSRQTDKMIL